MGQRTPLYQCHVDAGAKLVDFGGWDMPLNYGSQIEEHHAVRQHAGAFDVSHMTVVDVDGPEATQFLRHLLANDVARLTDTGRALYTCMLNREGGVVDDLIVYFLGDGSYRLVVNAATRDKDLAWIEAEAEPFSTAVRERADTAMIAVQGPKARELVASVLPEAVRTAALALKPFSALSVDDVFIGRTGYTGEDGFELIVPAASAVPLWDAFVAAGVRPCGLGARDTLRLEAGMNLYGNDMDEATSPLEAGLGWTIAWEPSEREFVGREPLAEVKSRSDRRIFRGLLLEDRGVLRDHQKVIVQDVGEGEITSGGFSPTLGRSIALARLPAGDYQDVEVEVRGKRLRARVVKPPFVRNGEIKIDLD